MQWQTYEDSCTPTSLDSCSRTAPWIATGIISSSCLRRSSADLGGAAKKYGARGSGAVQESSGADLSGTWNRPPKLPFARSATGRDGRRTHWWSGGYRRSSSSRCDPPGSARSAAYRSSMRKGASRNVGSSWQQEAQADLAAMGKGVDTAQQSRMVESFGDDAPSRSAGRSAGDGRPGGTARRYTRGKRGPEQAPRPRERSPFSRQSRSSSTSPPEPRGRSWSRGSRSGSSLTQAKLLATEGSWTPS